VKSSPWNNQKKGFGKQVSFKSLTEVDNDSAEVASSGRSFHVADGVSELQRHVYIKCTKLQDAEKLK